MAVEGVVLYVGGGEAEHSAELMRMSNFFHFRGQEGWLTASSGVCTPTNSHIRCKCWVYCTVEDSVLTGL